MHTLALFIEDVLRPRVAPRISLIRVVLLAPIVAATWLFLAWEAGTGWAALVFAASLMPLLWITTMLAEYVAGDAIPFRRVGSHAELETLSATLVWVGHSTGGRFDLARALRELHLLGVPAPLDRVECCLAMLVERGHCWEYDDGGGRGKTWCFVEDDRAQWRGGG